jgi:hypothetical protein
MLRGSTRLKRSHATSREPLNVEGAAEEPRSSNSTTPTSCSAKLTAIKNRAIANDRFYTPDAIAKQMVDMIEFDEHTKIMEPCRGGGAIY